jgi:Family of unknown function (DUF6506)
MRRIEMADERKLQVAFIHLAPGADPAIDRSVKEGVHERTTIVAVPDESAAARVAAELADDGVDLIELYAGLRSPAAAAAIDAVGGRVPVGLVGHDDPRAAPAGNTAIIYHAEDADPAVDRVVSERGGKRTTFVAVPGTDVIARVARGLVDEGAEQIELCGGLGPVPAAQVIEAVGEKVPVGAVLFGVESVTGTADYKARFEARVAQGAAA